MAYNPYHLVPDDNPNAIWCEYCGDQIMDFDGPNEGVYLLFGVVVHSDCLVDYTESLQLQIERLDDKVEEMVRKGLS